MTEVLRMANIWFRERTTVTFHDPLAAACIFEPGLCEYQQGEVSILMDEGPGAGLSTFQASSSGRHLIATGVHAPAFYENFFGIVQE